MDWRALPTASSGGWVRPDRGQAEGDQWTREVPTWCTEAQAPLRVRQVCGRIPTYAFV